MKHTLPFIALSALSLVLSACSDGGTTTTLDANPSLSLPLPENLQPQNAAFLNTDNLRPVVSLSNGAVVSMVKNDQQSWSGTANLETGAVYKVAVTWVEIFNGRDLSLTALDFDLAVGRDGTALQSNTSGYREDFDADGDGPFNLIERREGTDPFVNEAGGPGSIPSENPEDGFPIAPEPVSSDPVAPAPVVPDPVVPDPVVPDPVVPDPVVPDPVVPDPVVPDPVVPDPVVPDPAVPDPAVPDPAVPDPVVPDPVVPVPAVPDPIVPEPVVPIPVPTPVTADVIVPRISPANAPVIDGLGVTLGRNNAFTGEWADAVQSDNGGAILDIDNLMIDIDAETVTGNVPFRRWAAMHDGRYLYVVIIVDDNGERERDSGLDIFFDDSIEIFLDADNSKSSFYGIDDFHQIIPLRAPGSGASKRGVSSGDIAGPNSSTASFGLDFSTGPGAGPDGLRRANFEQDVYEVRIDLDTIDVSGDAPFGFEIQVNDDDDGFVRDSKWGWKHPARVNVDVDNTFFDPSFMGTLMLE